MTTPNPVNGAAVEDVSSLEQQVITQAKHAIRDAIREKLGSAYNSPLQQLIERVVGKHAAVFETLLSDAITGMYNDPSFRAEVTAAARSKLAKTLIDKMGGEMEKRVNDLKSNPATRARITLAIEQIVAGGTQ